MSVADPSAASPRAAPAVPEPPPLQQLLLLPAPRSRPRVHSPLLPESSLPEPLLLVHPRSLALPLLAQQSPVPELSPSLPAELPPPRAASQSQVRPAACFLWQSPVSAEASLRSIEAAAAGQSSAEPVPPFLPGPSASSSVLRQRSSLLLEQPLPRPCPRASPLRLRAPPPDAAEVRCAPSPLPACAPESPSAHRPVWKYWRD